MKETYIDALMVEPGGKPQKVSIINDIESFEILVSDDVRFPTDVEFFKLEDRICLFRNREGALLGLLGNRRVGDEIIAGTFFVVGISDNGDFCSLSDEKMEKYRKRFWKIEKFTDKEVSDSYWDSWFSFFDELELS